MTALVQRWHYATAAPIFQNREQSDPRETHDKYRGEIFRYGRHRVIVCRDGIQWIIQRNRTAAGKVAGPRWASKSHCTTRRGLMLDWQRHVGCDAPELNNFPDRIKSQINLPSPKTLVGRLK